MVTGSEAIPSQREESASDQGQANDVFRARRGVSEWMCWYW
jgi:hypothetical protein